MVINVNYKADVVVTVTLTVLKAHHNSCRVIYAKLIIKAVMRFMQSSS